MEDNKLWQNLTNCWKYQVNPTIKNLQSQLKTQLSTLVQGANQSDNVVQIGARTFNIQQKLGEGGYSFVYLVHEQPLSPEDPPGPSYALKKVLADREQLEEAQKEMTIMNRLRHPNILPLLDSATVALPSHRGGGGASHAVYMLFPLYDGGNLWDYLEKRLQHGSPLTTPEVVSIGLQLCAGLLYMHSQGMAHWDVKPHNVLLSWTNTNTTSNTNTTAQQQQQQFRQTSSQPLEGALAPSSPFNNTTSTTSSSRSNNLENCHAVLIDFGSTCPAVQQAATRTQAVTLQEDAERHSTAPYRPPELWDVATGALIDERVDVWALGCVLYFAMVGESPFERVSNESGGSLMLAILNGTITWPDEVVRRYPAELKDVVSACLTVDQQKRPTVADIERLLQELSSSS